MQCAGIITGVAWHRSYTTMWAIAIVVNVTSKYSSKQDHWNLSQRVLWAHILGRPKETNMSSSLPTNFTKSQEQFQQDKVSPPIWRTLARSIWRHTKNKYVKRYNNTIVSHILHYVTDNKRGCKTFVQPLTYEWNSEVLSLTNTTSFSLVLSHCLSWPESNVTNFAF